MADSAPAAPDPVQLLKSGAYLKLLVLAALIGAPISAVAYFFLKVVDLLQKAVFTNLPVDVLGFSKTPSWWPLPAVAVAGLLTALAIKYLPGRGGHSPAD